MVSPVYERSGVGEVRRVSDPDRRRRDGRRRGPERSAEGPTLVGIVGNRVLSSSSPASTRRRSNRSPNACRSTATATGGASHPITRRSCSETTTGSCTGGLVRCASSTSERCACSATYRSCKNAVSTTAWLDRTHVVAVANAGDCIGPTTFVVASVDAESRRLVRSTMLVGDVVEVAQAPDRLVLLLAPRQRIGAARLAGRRRARATSARDRAGRGSARAQISAARPAVRRRSSIPVSPSIRTAGAPSSSRPATGSRRSTSPRSACATATPRSSARRSHASGTGSTRPRRPRA